jgi:hypothetical protein
MLRKPNGTRRLNVRCKPRHANDMTDQSFEYKALRFLNDRFEVYNITDDVLKIALYDIPESEYTRGMTSLRDLGYIKNKDLYEKGLTITTQGQVRLQQMQKVVDKEKVNEKTFWERLAPVRDTIATIGIISTVTLGWWTFSLNNDNANLKIENKTLRDSLSISRTVATKTIQKTDFTVECKSREIVKDPKGDPDIIDSCFYKNIVTKSHGTPDYKGRYFYSYSLFIKNQNVKNHEIFNGDLPRLEDSLNKVVKAEFKSLFPLSESCFDGFSLRQYTIDDFGLAFTDSCMAFHLSFGLPSACLAVDGITINYRLQDLGKYLK